VAGNAGGERGESRMKERGIMFSGESIRQIVAGRKTQTRRLSGLHRVNAAADEWEFLGGSPRYSDDFAVFRNKAEIKVISNPFVVDNLWCKEVYAVRTDTVPGTALAKHYLLYKADGGDLEMTWHEYRGWKSPMFMPRWASRLTLIPTVHSPERVNTISEDDAKAEGVTSLRGFAELWDSINAKPKPVRRDGTLSYYVSYPFDDVQEDSQHRGKPWYVRGNPWVFPISFKKDEEESK